MIILIFNHVNLQKLFNMKHIVAPSILSADFSNLQKDIEMINNSKADWFHVDVMDGVFVPNISFGFPVLKAIKKYATKPLDVHLMITNPDNYILDFKNAGADILTVHYEACTHLNRTIQSIKALNMKAGVALNPHTPIALLEDIIRDVDVVLIMSVNPGFGGQSFIENTYKKVIQIRDLIDKSGSSALIEIDGGVNLKTGKLLLAAGANALVAGSFVFKSENPLKTISLLKDL